MFRFAVTGVTKFEFILLSLLALTTLFSSPSLAQFTEVPTALPQVYGVGAIWGDYDADGDLDIAIAGNSTGINRTTRIYRNDGNNQFTDINANLVALRDGDIAWGDYDNDGDLDLALAGSSGSVYVAKIYRNDGNDKFTDINAGLTPVWSCSLAWGDYDNDGDLDLALAGRIPGSYDCLTRIYRNDHGQFKDIKANLAGVDSCCLAWGDYDNDGDLDIAVAGQKPTNILTAKIYRNEGNGFFRDIQANLQGVQSASLAWGDYDNDGDLDIVISGGDYTKIYRNDAGIFVDSGISVQRLAQGCVCWGDYDNDGDVDLALSGFGPVNGGYGYISKLYRNDGAGHFYDTLTNWYRASSSLLSWGDYDNDGDLDLLFTGYDSSSSTQGITKLYRNDGTAVNTPPAPPTSLNAVYDGIGHVFSWNAGSDIKTPAAGLSYNIRIGTFPGGSDVFSGMAGSSGYRRIPAIGNAQKKLSWRIRNLPLGRYYWSVQAVDTSYAGSQWATEQMIDVDIVHSGLCNLKLRTDGTRVVPGLRVVTKAFSDFFYIEEDNRSSGIRVDKINDIPEGTKVSVTGTLRTTADGERYIAAETVSTNGTGSAAPLHLSGKDLGGGILGLQCGVWSYIYHPNLGSDPRWMPAAGTNNIGLLVKISGRVTSVNSTVGYLYIDDGSGLVDGTSTGDKANLGIRVMCDPAGVAVGDYLEVSGISSFFKNQWGYSVRRILVSRPFDINKL